MPNARSHLDHLIGDAEVESASAQPPAAAAGKGCRDMRLVRRFVSAETRVAVDAKDGVLRLRDILRRELGELGVDGAGQLQHRRLHVLFEQVFTRLKPLPAVVALQTAKELDHVFRKTSKGCSHEILLYNLTR